MRRDGVFRLEEAVMHKISDMTVAGGRKWAKVVPVHEGKSGWVFHDFLTCG
jgi:hypothetical protein